ncbi:helix-turn-helix domain-containing protein [Streptomyces sp. NPDC001797]|uniref:helix-turn-helix domain-containing protein n=1 Tax=Streptomyces sp. NPDC001797 TaxID=3364610 RepID=UPI003692F420
MSALRVATERRCCDALRQSRSGSSHVQPRSVASSQVENGKNNISLDRIFALADALDVDVAELFRSLGP